MKLLILSWNYKGWTFETLWHEQKAIAKFNPDTVFYGPGFIYNNNSLPNIIKEIYGCNKPDAIIFYVPENFLLNKPLGQEVVTRFKVPLPLRRFPLDMHKVKIPKILRMYDFWHCVRLEWRKIILKHGFNAAFCAYSPPFVSRELFDGYFDSDIQDYCSIKTLLPFIDQEIFKDYGLPKEYDVTLLGARTDSFHPLRIYFDQALKAQVGMRYFTEKHPGYKFYESANNMLIGENYAKAINRSRIFVTCCTKYKIPTFKIFEVLACKTLLMCDWPYGAEDLGLVDGETFIEVNRSNFLEKVKWCLNKPGEIERISENGYRLFLVKHSIEKRAQEFTKLLQNVLSTRYSIDYAAQPRFGFFNQMRYLKNFLTRFFYGKPEYIAIKFIYKKLRGTCHFYRSFFSIVTRLRLLIRAKLLGLKEHSSRLSVIEKILRINWSNHKIDLHPIDRRLAIIDEKDIRGMSTENIRFLINEIVRVLARGGTYLEVGMYQGASLLSAALFNPSTRCIGIDNFAQFNLAVKNESILKENLNKLGKPKNIEYYKMDYKEAIQYIFSKEPKLKVNVYYYDGEHSYESQLEGLEAIKPYLADKCAILVDDVNDEPVEKANEEFIKKNRCFTSAFKIKTERNSSKGWWNGFEIILRNANSRESLPAAGR